MTDEEKKKRLDNIKGKSVEQQLAELYNNSIETMRWEHEQAEMRHEKRERKMFAIILTLILLLVASNFGWLYYENQFEDVTTQTIEATQDSAGVNIVGGRNVTYVPESEDNNN